MVNSRDINDLHPVLQRGACEFLRRAKAQEINVLITQTYRDSEYQNSLYEQGRTKPGSIVTNVRGGSSMHNYRLAFDICKNVKGQEYSDTNFFKQCGKIWRDMGGAWGGDWTSFVDMPHMEFTNGLTISQLQNGKTLTNDVKMKWEIADASPQVNPQASYPIESADINALVKVGVISSPEYWQAKKDIQWLDVLFRKSAIQGVCDKRVENGIADLDTVFNVLKEAGIVSDPAYWKGLIAKDVPYIKLLLTNISNKCRIILEKIVQAEAGNQGVEGQELVANVVLNRCKSPKHPNGIYNVVFAPNQFAQWAYFQAVPSVSVKQAVTNVLNGKDNSKGATYFCTVKSAQSSNSWHANTPNLIEVLRFGDHVFYKEK